jgi:hypothetical protein
MARSLDALDRANVEVLAISSSSYRQSFCFLVRTRGTGAKPPQAIEAALALELAHGYVHPGSQVDGTWDCWPWWAKACGDSGYVAGRSLPLSRART